MSSVDEMARQRSKYPAPVSVKIGRNVSRYLYDQHSDALQASLLAERIGTVLAMQGRDFGYDLPGQIIKEANGLFSVTVP